MVILPPAAQVGIIITCYNQAAFIGAAIESALSQSYPLVQIVIVDDGSSDNSRAVIEAAIGDDARCTLCPQTNKGCSAARQAGFEALGTQVNYILWLDGDDCLLPDAIEVLLTHLQAPEQADAPAVAGLALPIDSQGKMLPRPGYIHTWIPNRIALSDYEHTWFLITPGTTLWKRDAIDKVGPYPEGVWVDSENLRCEDVQIACLITAACGPIAGLSVPVMLKREFVGWCSQDAERMSRAVNAYQDWVGNFIDSQTSRQA